MPQEAYTNELYYNKDLLKKLGVELPANAQFTQAQFLDLVKKAKAAGMTPIAQGVGDRPFPGAYILGEALLRKLGKDDYRKLFTGKLSFADPRVVEVFKWVKELVDAGAYPKNFMTLKLGESHYYFYTQARRADVADGQLVYRPRLRAGGQGRPAAGLPAGHHAVPGDGRRRLQSVQDVRRSAPASPSMPRASTRSSRRHSWTRCRRRRWARAGSRRSICRPASRPT